MAEKYLDYSGVQTLWNAVKDRDDQIAAGKAGYIAYDADNKKIQLWASEEAYTASKSDESIVPISTVDATPFIKDGMLEDVEIVPASEVGPIVYNGTSYNDETLFIQFKWNTESGKTSDYILLTDIAPVYTEGEGIDITGNKISFESGKADQITTTDKITLGGTWLGNQLKANGIKEIPSGTDLQKFFQDLLSVESWPSNPRRVIPSSLSVNNPAPSVKFYTNSACTSQASSSVEVGTDVYLMITGTDASASASISYAGFDYGYSTVPDTDPSFSKKTGQPSSVSITGSEVANGKYSIVVTQNTTGETISTFTPDANAANVKLSSPVKYTVKDGSVSVTAKQTCPDFTGSCAASKLNKYYALSTLEATSDDHVVAAGSDVTLTGDSKSTSATASISGFRKLFYGSDVSNDPSIFTSDYIRAAAGGNYASAATGNYKPVAAGKKMVWIAFPATYNWKVTAAYLPPYTSNNFASKFVSKTVSVNGANKTNPINYTVLYAAYDLAFSEADVRITLA